MTLKLYEVNPQYISYLSNYAPHLFHNKKAEQTFSRKYIGIILKVNGFNYFAPLSSFKPKHQRMRESPDFIKVKDYAVININNMFPVPDGEYTYVNISSVNDIHYRALLQSEYRIIKAQQRRILESADYIYDYKSKNGNSTPLSKRCNNFKELERVCKLYK